MERLERRKLTDNEMVITKHEYKTLLKLAEMAYKDMSLGIFNRNWLEMKRGSYNKERFSACILDINNFKKINDDRGHVIADQYLQSFVNRLKEFFNDKNDRICRYGGDEILVLTRNDINEKKLEKHVGMIASLGVCKSSGNETLKAVTKKADKNLNKNKRYFHGELRKINKNSNLFVSTSDIATM